MTDTLDKDIVKFKGIFNLKKYASDNALAQGIYYSNSNFENGMLNTGINEIWQLVKGASVNTFTQANTQLGVGDSNTAFAASQTDLQASTNKTYVTSTSVTTGSSQTIVIVASFGSGSANYSWQEFVAKQATSSICLDRAVSNQGTKTSGQTWVLTLTITGS